MLATFIWCCRNMSTHLLLPSGALYEFSIDEISVGIDSKVWRREKLTSFYFPAKLWEKGKFNKNYVYFKIKYTVKNFPYFLQIIAAFEHSITHEIQNGLMLECARYNNGLWKRAALPCEEREGTKNIPSNYKRVTCFLRDDIIGN